MAKKTSRKSSKAKKTAKKSAVKKKLAGKKAVKKSLKKKSKKPAKKTAAKTARKTVKKAVKKAASKPTPAKATEKRAATGTVTDGAVDEIVVKRPQAKSKSKSKPKTEASPTSSAEAALTPPAKQAVIERENPLETSTSGEADTPRESIRPAPEEIADSAADKPPATPVPAGEPASSPHLFANLLTRVHTACRALAAEGDWPADIDLSRVVVEPPRDAAHGDMATNAAMVLAREARAKPRDLAEQIAARLRADDLIASVDVAGPGFINLTLRPSVWSDELRVVLREGDAYGRSAIGAAEKVNVEYVSANPTGPMHVGHCRGAVFGDALCSLLQFAGYDVTREYYINDAGAQVDVLARSALLRYREALGEEIGAIPEGLYPGDYLKPVGQALAAEYGDRLLSMPEAEWLPIVRTTAVAMMMEMIKEDLAALNIQHDVFFSERSLIEGGNNRVAETVDFLRAKGDVYVGRLPPPKGGAVEDYEDREQTLFRATAYGDDVDRPLLKSDGSYTYFASDIAYHKDKFDRGFANQIDIWGADHGGYVKRMQAAVRAATGGKGALDVKLCQLVKLMRHGEPVKMSKRSGDFITLREVVEEVGRDAVRFMMLMRKNDATLDFDLAKVIETSKENPVFYVQYGHARCRSIFREAYKKFPDLRDSEFGPDADLAVIDDVGEIAILKRIAQFPRLIEQAGAAHEPHRVAFYLYELASDLHAQYNRGRDVPHLRFIRDDNRRLTGARLAFVRGVETVLKSGLGLLGVSAPDEMR